MTIKINDRRSSAILLPSSAEFATSSKKPELEEIAAVSRDLSIPTFGGNTLPNPDKVLETRGKGKGLALYDEVKRDPRVRTVLHKRKTAITCREWQVVPASDSDLDKKAAEEVERQLKDLKFDKFTKSMLDAVPKGYSICEIIWKIEGSKIVASQIKSRKPGRFVFNKQLELRLLTKENPTDGIEVPERKFIHHAFDSEYENPYGHALSSTLFWPVWFKRQGITFWLKFADKFGSPTVVGKYRPGTPKPDKENLLAACRAVSHSAGITIPEGMMIEYLEASRTGSIDTYEKLCRYMDEQIAEVALGETGTTNQSGSGGSRARDEVGNDVRLEIAKDDSDSVSETMNETIIPWITEYNFPGANPPKVWRMFEEAEDSNKLAERDSTLASTGQVKYTKTYLMKQYGFEDEDIIVIENPNNDIKPGQNDPEKDKTASFSEKINPLPTVSDKIDSRLAKGIDDIIEPIRKLLNESGDLVEFNDKLLDLYGDMDPTELGTLMQNAIVLSTLNGYSDVKDGK